MNDLSPEDLASMTASEREAYLAPDEDENTPLGDGDDAAAPAAEIITQPAADQLNAAEPEDDDEDTNKVVLPMYDSPAPKDYENKINALTAEKSTAYEQLMGGDIDSAEFRKIDERVTAEIRKLDGEKVKAEIAQEHNESVQRAQAEMAGNRWNRTVKTLLAAEKTAGIDYGDKVKFQELDELVKAYSSVAAQKGMTDDGLKASKWALEQAASVMRTKYAPAKTATAKPSDDKDRKPNLSLVPPLISKLPNSANATIEGDEFAAINSLDGDAYEKAIASLARDPERYERFKAA